MCIAIHENLHGTPVVVADAQAALGLLHQALAVDERHDDRVALQLGLAEQIHEEVLHRAQRGDLMQWRYGAGATAV